MAAGDVRRALQQRLRRSGALSAVSGFSRRRVLVRCALRVREPDGRVAVQGGRGQRRLARPAVLRRLRAHRPLASVGIVGSDPAVLQRRYPDAVPDTGRRRARARRCDPTAHSEPAGEPERVRAAGRPVRPDRGAQDRQGQRAGDALAVVRHQGRLHDDAALGRAALGGELRLRQRRRGGAALRLAHERLHGRRRVDEGPQHAAGRVRRLVVRQPRPGARLGQPASPHRLDLGPRPRPHDAVAVEHRADDQRRRLHQARAKDAVDRVRVVRGLEQRRGAAAVHDQPDAAAIRVAPGDGRSRRARLLDKPESGVAAGDGVALQRPAAPLRLRQPDPAYRHPAVHQLRHVRQDLGHGRPGALLARAHDLHRRRDLDRAVAARTDGGLHAQQQQLRLPHLREHGGGHAEPVGRRDGLAMGDVSRAGPSCRIARDRAWTSSCSSRSASSPRCATSTSPTARATASPARWT